MPTTTRYAIEFTDLHGRKYLGGARYTDRARALEQVRYERIHTVNTGRITGAIPGGGVARHVVVVEVTPQNS